MIPSKRASLGLCVLLALGLARGHAQTRPALHVSVLLVDTDLNVKPVPRHALVGRRTAAGTTPQRIVTGLDGKVDVSLEPGTYTIASERAVEFQGPRGSESPRARGCRAAQGIAQRVCDAALTQAVLPKRSRA